MTSPEEWVRSREEVHFITPNDTTMRENLLFKEELPCGLTVKEPGGKPAWETVTGQWSRAREP